MFKDRQNYLEDLLTKCGKGFKTGKLLRLIEMGSTRAEAKQAIEFISRLDKLVDIYFHPAGAIAVNGYQDGLCRYKTFKGL